MGFIHLFWRSKCSFSFLFFLSHTQCIELMGDGCLNSEHFEEMGGILKGKLEEHFKNQELRQGDLSKESKNEVFHEVQINNFLFLSV